MWENWGLCGNFATNMSYYGGGNVGIIRLMMPQLLGKMRRRLGASCIFARLMKRFEQGCR